MEWKPQPKQELALTRNEDEILFGGARGGGKTDTGQAWLLYDINEPRYRALVLRRNHTDLKDWIDRAKIMFSGSGGKFVNGYFEFESGAKILTGHLKDDNAYTKYQGHEYQKMLLEEITQIPRESDYEKLIASCRSTIKGIKPQIMATTNPDGAGRKWVKARWNIPDRPDNNKIYKNGNKVFIPSRLEDNQILMEKNPTYKTRLENIKDEELKRAWLYGDWTGFNIEGAVYKKELDELYGLGGVKRIVKIQYEPSLPVYTWWDIGVSDSTSIGFFQKVGVEWRLIDYYENNNVGIDHYVKVLKDKTYIYGKHFAPHDIMVREFSTGISRYETAKSLGIEFETKINGETLLSAVPRLSIAEGINAVRQRISNLWIDEDKASRFIECFTNYRREFNEKLGEYNSEPLHDQFSHGADMIRYWASTPVELVVENIYINYGVNESYGKQSIW